MAPLKAKVHSVTGLGNIQKGYEKLPVLLLSQLNCLGKEEQVLHLSPSAKAILELSERLSLFCPLLQPTLQDLETDPIEDQGYTNALLIAELRPCPDCFVEQLDAGCLPGVLDARRVQDV